MASLQSQAPGEHLVHQSPRFLQNNPELALEVDSSNFETRKQCGIAVNEEDGGVSLTWEDLWVNVPNGKDGNRRAILQGLTGYAQPGQMLAIMGPSGCGKSTLLDALAGRLDSRTRQSGDVLINGRKQALAYGTSVAILYKHLFFVPRKQLAYMVEGLLTYSIVELYIL